MAVTCTLSFSNGLIQLALLVQCLEGRAQELVYLLQLMYTEVTVYYTTHWNILGGSVIKLQPCIWSKNKVVQT